MRNIIDVLVVAAVGFCFGICLGIAVTRGEADRLRKIIVLHAVEQMWHVQQDDYTRSRDRYETHIIQQCIDASAFDGLPCNLGKPDAKH